jgi:recombinational DNA repair protein RecT
MAKTQQITALTDVGVSQILESARDLFTNIIQQSQVAAVIQWQKEAPFARQIILKDHRLLTATHESLKNAITNLAAVGLTLNPIKKHATILPRWNDKLKCHEAQLVVMYQGLMWLAGQAGVSDITVDVVYSADKFDSERTDQGDKWSHKVAHGVPRDGTFSRFVLAYVGARMPTSKMMKLELVPCEDIYTMREKSESYLDKDTGKPRPNSPWVVFFDEMAKKAALKRASKRWEEAVIHNDDWKRLQTAVALDNAMEGVIPQRVSDIPGTAEHITSGNDKLPEKLSMQQITELEKLAEQVAPNNDEYPNNTGHYLTKIARTYRASKLADVDATKFDEIKGRINEAIEKIKNKKAGDAKAGKQGTSQQGKPSGTTGQEKGSGGQTTSGGAKDGGQATSGGASTGGSGGSTDREPGSDDDAGGSDN